MHCLTKRDSMTPPFRFFRHIKFLSLAAIILVVQAAMPWPGLQPLGITPANAQSAAPSAPAAASATSAPRLIDRVLAIVNTEVITESEVVRREQQFLANLRRQNIAAPNAELLRKEVLDRMINDRAMIQLARETGIRIDEPTIDRAVARIAEQNGLSIDGLRQQLQREGTSYARFRQEIREEIMLTRLREREVENRVQVSESEINTFIAAQGQEPKRVDEMLISQVLVRVGEDASRETVTAAQEKIRRAQADLRSGRPFADVAKAYSEAPDAAQGGSLGWRTRDLLPTLFVDAVANQKPGSVVGPIRSPAGLHLLLLEDRRSAMRLQEVPVHRVRHILVRIDNQNSEESARRRLQNIIRALEQGSDFAVLARDFSQDPGSMARGGELDWAYPGDLVPEFERVMFALPIGQVSEPVRTQFGLHLIQVLERKREPLTEERLRTAARLILREQKLQEALEEWTREVRANTYVEIKRDER
jgi:peptidyl-prolyl cis-trans isomerase SurA